MKIYIVKHYWKDGENATWERHPKVDDKLFEYLKKNYHNFVKDRKKMIEKDGYFIYLCYKDSKDVYDRNITNITFFVSKKEVKKDFCNTHFKNLELEIVDKTKNIKILAIGAIALLIIGFMGIKIFSSKNTSKESHKQRKYEAVQNYTPLIDNWNDQVSNIIEDVKIQKKYRLSRDDNKKLIAQLNSFVKPFYTGIESKILDEMKRKNANKYEDFAKANHTDANITFKVSMSKDEIKKGLKKITHERAIHDIVKKVLIMNDKDVFLKESGIIGKQK